MHVPDKLSYPQLTSTRFVAAFLVIIYHFGILPRHVIPFVWFDTLNFFNLAGSCAVYYFFVLSGFVLTAAYRTKPINYGLFIANRLGRIYPVYLLALLVIILVVIIPSGAVNSLINSPTLHTVKSVSKLTIANTQALDKLSIFLNLILCHSWNVSTWQSFNGPGWSLSVEFFLYLLFPFLIPVLRRAHNSTLRTLLLISTLLSIACTALAEPAVTDISRGFLFFGSPLLAVPSFLIGMLTCELGLRQALAPSFFNPLAVLLISSCVCVVLISVYPGVDFALTPLFALIIWSLTQDKSSLSKLLSHPKLVLLGEISYGYYILQVPVLLVGQRWLHLFNNTSDTFFFYLLNGLLVIIAWASFQWLETPIRKQVNSYTSRLRQASCLTPATQADSYVVTQKSGPHETQINPKNIQIE